MSISQCVARGTGAKPTIGLKKKRGEYVLSAQLRSLFAATLSPLMTFKALLQALRKGGEGAKICLQTMLGFFFIPKEMKQNLFFPKHKRFLPFCMEK